MKNEEKNSCKAPLLYSYFYEPNKRTRQSRIPVFASKMSRRVL